MGKVRVRRFSLKHHDPCVQLSFPSGRVILSHVTLFVLIIWSLQQLLSGHLCRCTASDNMLCECHLEEFDYRLCEIAALLSPLWDSNEKWLLTVEHCCCLDYLSLDLFGWGGFIPFKDPPLALHSGRAPGPSCDSRSLPVRAHRAPNQTGSSLQKPKKPPFLSFLHHHQFLCNQFSASYSASLCSSGISSFSVPENGTHEGEY